MGYLQHGRRHMPGGTDPIPHHMPWASGRGDLDTGSDTSGAFNFFDLDVVATNSPSTFGLATGPQGSKGLEILEHGWYHIVANAFFVTHDPLANPQNYYGKIWGDYFSAYQGFFGDGGILVGRGVAADFAVSPQCIIETQYNTTFSYHPIQDQVTQNGPPYNVIEFGMRQTTTVDGFYGAGFTITKLPVGVYNGSDAVQDFTEIAYLT